MDGVSMWVLYCIFDVISVEGKYVLRTISRQATDSDLHMLAVGEKMIHRPCETEICQYVHPQP